MAITPHSLRRLKTNHLRARGIQLLDVVNILGQATLGTAPANYLQLYPVLQEQHLRQKANPAVVTAGPGRATLITLGEAIQLLRNRIGQAQALT